MTDAAPQHAAAPKPSVVARVRKLIVYVVALGAAIPTSIVLPSPWDVVIPAAIAILGAVVHYQVPNAPVPPKPSV